MTYLDEDGAVITKEFVGATHDLVSKTLTIDVFEFGKGTNSALTTDLLPFTVVYREEYTMNDKLLQAGEPTIEVEESITITLVNECGDDTKARI